jgi:hypothetical protein
MATGRDASQAKYSEQNILNSTYDKDFDILAIEMVGYDSSASALRRVAVNSDGEFVVNTEPIATGINGGPVNVGTTAVELTFTGRTKIISIKADSTNTGRVWFGSASVDSSGANAYGELTADSSVEIELDDTSTPLYVCASTASQKVYKAALT